MKSAIKSSVGSSWTRFVRVFWVAAVVLLSSYCTGPDTETKNEGLTEDEEYLVEAYADIVRARDLYAVNYLKSESLFTMLDSTIDTTRIANTIRGLNRTPDRWIAIFYGIERDLNVERVSEDGR